MKAFDIFYQAEGLNEIQYLEIGRDATFAILRSRLQNQHGLEGDMHFFIEDHDDPVDEEALIKDHASDTGLKVHLHRCRHVEVTVTYNNKTVERRFSPAATVAKVKQWAAEHKFDMSPEDAGEHVLQIAGKHERPPANTHIGALTDGRVCGLAFDLVPDERVNGALEAHA